MRILAEFLWLSKQDFALTVAAKSLLCPLCDLVGTRKKLLATLASTV